MLWQCYDNKPKDVRSKDNRPNGKRSNKHKVLLLQRKNLMNKVRFAGILKRSTFAAAALAAGSNLFSAGVASFWCLNLWAFYQTCLDNYTPKLQQDE